MKSVLFLSLCLLLISCQNAQDCKSSATPTKEIKEDGTTPSTCTENPSPENPSQDPLPTPPGEVPHEALIFDASVKFDKFEIDQEDKVHKAIEIIKKVVASEEFRAKVLTFSYKDTGMFVDTKLTNEEVYEMILTGAETLTPEVDHEMDLELELYYTSSSTVGYTKPDTNKIWMNTKYFNVFTSTQVAGNIFHEWTHKLGFEHAFTYSVSRDSSVPYALGYLVRDLGKQYE
ncbi:MAG: hypothetical protein ACJ76H_11135 [Bacteriovoracaceae bacterium]